MDTFSGDISALVFKGSVRGNLDQFSLDNQMLKVLMELDGKKNLAAVARSANMSMATLKAVLIKLQAIKVIEKVETTVNILSDVFFDFMRRQLSMALGPIAEFLIEDEILELGLEQDRFPVQRAAELVNLLARQIPRKDNKIAFQQAMSNKIKEMMT